MHAKTESLAPKGRYLSVGCFGLATLRPVQTEQMGLLFWIYKYSLDEIYLRPVRTLWIEVPFGHEQYLIPAVRDAHNLEDLCYRAA